MKWMLVFVPPIALCAILAARSIVTAEDIPGKHSDKPTVFEEIRKEIADLHKEVRGIREDVERLANRRYEYRLETINRLKTRDVGELVNNMAKEGWEFHSSLQNDSYLFRRVCEEKPLKTRP